MRHGFSLGILLTFVLALGCDTTKPTNPSTPKVSPSAKVNDGPAPAPTTDTPAPAGAIALKPDNTKIEFVGTKAEGKHVGGFAAFQGSVDVKGNDFASAKLTITMDTDSLTSDDPKLTGHLKSPDFFNVKTHPKATFTTTAIKAGGEGDATHSITGDLTLLGTSKPITFPAKVELSADTLTLNSEFKFNRMDFGMTYGKGKVDDMVSIKVSVKASRK